jgi:hypothetical protein
MDKTYTIIWVARQLARSGSGAPRFSQEEAEHLAAELNETHPGFVHQALNTATENSEEAISALRASLVPAQDAVTFPEVARVQAAEPVPEVDDKIIDLSSYSQPSLAAAAE